MKNNIKYKTGAEDRRFISSMCGTAESSLGDLNPLYGYSLMEPAQVHAMASSGLAHILTTEEFEEQKKKM
jgi:hypothetical protein